MTDIQWYPGHMTKAGRVMQDNIRLVDLVIELVDARVPLSSRNPDIDELGKNKARLLLLNKADLACENATGEWINYFRDLGFEAVKLDSRSRASLRAVQDAIRAACREKTERDRRRGIKNRPVRAMVAGIPNVGKSTFINSFAGRAAAGTGNRPGVTKGVQWVRLNKQVELLDTPGILWPKFEDPEVGLKLALVGSIKDEVLDAEELAVSLIGILRKDYGGVIAARYGVSEEGKTYDVLKDIAKNRGSLKKGGDPDTAKAASILLDEFRNGKLGRITLERP